MGRLRKLDLSSNKLGDRAALLQSYCSMGIGIARPSQQCRDLFIAAQPLSFILVHGRTLLTEWYLLYVFCFFLVWGWG